jgi:hypothetical protein
MIKPPPDAETRRGAVGSGTPVSQSSKFSPQLHSLSAPELQVAKLRRLFQFPRETAWPLVFGEARDALCGDQSRHFSNLKAPAGARRYGHR